MGFFKDGAQILGVCIGTIIVIILLISGASYIMDMDFSTSIDNNTTIELNGVTITVPQTNNYSINESASLSNVNDTEKFGIEKMSNITEGNAYQYYDPNHNITIYVVDNNRTSYSDIPDLSSLEVLDGEIERTHIEKRTIDDKTVVLYVTEQKGLSKLIADSARKS